VTRLLSRTLKLVLAVGITASLVGCANFAYYAQAVGGQMELLRRAQPISTITDDPQADPNLKRALAKVVQLRAFASRELQLPENQSYTRYADLERPYVVWNAFAAEEFAIEPKQWCFVGVGCVSYRGFFSKADAESFAEELRREGYDVSVGGVPAYSTLGWFNDPVLNTFVGYSETELARLIFHELAHQLVYVRDDSVFNESVATAVELEGVRRWLECNGSAAQRAAWIATQQRQTAFTEIVFNTRRRLQVLYASGVNDTDKRAAKARLFAELRAELTRLQTAQDGVSRSDRWQSLQLNNAHLASIATYTQLLPAFQALLVQQHGDLERFYAAVKDMSRLPKSERAATLRSLIEGPRKDAGAS
jgi:predicted aminopeptidase